MQVSNEFKSTNNKALNILRKSMFVLKFYQTFSIEKRSSVFHRASNTND